jgi:hypothetical protein
LRGEHRATIVDRHNYNKGMCYMRTLALLILLSTSPAHAIMVQLTQTGILDDEAGTAVTLTAFAHGDGVLSSIFVPYDFDPTYINPDFSLALFNVRFSLGDTVFESVTGRYSQVGDLGGPGVTMLLGHFNLVVGRWESLTGRSTMRSRQPRRQRGSFPKSNPSSSQISIRGHIHCVIRAEMACAFYSSRVTSS